MGFFSNKFTGFVSRSQIASEVGRHYTASSATLESLTRSLYAVQITVSQWEIASAIELKNGHIAQAMFGAGGRENMGPAEWGRVGGCA